MKPNNPYLKSKKGKNTPKKNNFPSQEAGTLLNSDEKLQQRSNRFTTSFSTPIEEEKQHGKHDLFIPSCIEMCPISECIERERTLDVHPLEADNNNGSLSYEAIALNVHRKIDLNKAVKKYRRPAAGAPPPKPSEIRTPEVILKTLTFLMSPGILGRSDVPLTVRSAFVRDRGRSLRSDLSRQLKQGKEGVILGLEMARFHALIAHELCDEDRSEFDPFQNSEQLSKTLTTLNEFTSLMSSSELSEFKAMKILTQIEDISFSSFSASNLTGVVAWAFSLLIAYRTKDAAGWIRRAINGPPNCSPCTSLILCSFAHFHLNKMRCLLLEQMQGIFSIPISQVMSIKDLFVPFGFESEQEAIYFFSQFPLSFSENGFKFTRDSTIPEFILPLKSKLLVSNRLYNIQPGNYEKALCLSITTSPSTQPFIIGRFSTSLSPTMALSNDNNDRRTRVNVSTSPSKINGSSKINDPINLSNANYHDSSVYKNGSSIQINSAPCPNSAFLTKRKEIARVDPNLCSRLTTTLIKDVIDSTLQPFIASAIRKRISLMKSNISKHAMESIISSITIEIILSSFFKRILMKRVVRHWKLFIISKNLTNQLSSLIPTHNPNPEYSLPLLLEGHYLEFYKLLFQKCQFNPLPLNVTLLDWTSGTSSIPKCSYVSNEITLNTIYKCKSLISQWKIPQFEKKHITLIFLFIDTVTDYENACRQIKLVRSKIIQNDVDFLFIALIVKRSLEIKRKEAANKLAISSFHVNVFYENETSEIGIIDWIRPSLSLLLLPGGVAWIESEILFQESLNETLLDAVVDSDFAAFISECKNPVLDGWRCSHWYRRYVIVEVCKMQTWEKNQAGK